MDKKIKVSVILPAHNEEKNIKEAINSIKNQSYDQNLIEIIVVDNNSTDKTAEVAKSLSNHVYFLADGPVGKVRNTGANLSHGEILFFLDADCIAPEYWISYAVNKITHNPNLILGGGYELRKHPSAIEKFWLLEGPEGALLPIDLLGGCIAIQKKVFVDIGGFDETITSGEDSKLSHQLKRKDYSVEIHREMSVIHLGNPSSLNSFFKRQIWHSENYFNNIKETLTDKTFLLIAIFACASIASLSLLSKGSHLAITTALIAAAVPAIFSLKRIARSKNLTHIKKIHRIYLIDLTYTIARCIGLIKGALRRLGLKT